MKICQAAEVNVIYEAERCSRTFKTKYDNKYCNRCLRKSDADKHFAEVTFDNLQGCIPETFLQ